MATPKRRAKKRVPEQLSDAGKLRKEDRDIKMASDIATLVNQVTGENGILARLTVMEKELDEVTAMANRWKGVTIALLGIGSLGGWVIATWGKIKGFFA
jgi:mevalonate kinase